MLQPLYESAETGGAIGVDEIDRIGEQVLAERGELLGGLWDDLPAEMRADLADLATRELRLSAVPDRRLQELELRGLRLDGTLREPGGRRGKQPPTSVR
jgi:hypothetical protein